MMIASEIVETRSRVGRLSEQLETLAAVHGVPVMWGESLEGGCRLMSRNSRTLADLTAALRDLIAEFIATDLADADAKDLVPAANAIRESASNACGRLDAEIQRRVLEGIEVPGAELKDGVSHRKWSNTVAASEAVFAQFGVKGFKLDSPAAIEKLGEAGKALVAVASFKPPAPKKVVY